jgi:integrase
MPRLKNNPPRYPSRPHKTGQARIKFRGATYYLGVWGTPDSHQRYADFVERWRAGTLSAPLTVPSVPTIAALVLAWDTHAPNLLVDGNGQPTREVYCYRLSLNPLLAAHASLPVDEFTPALLDRLRQDMLASGLARKTVNQRVGRIRRVFSWGVTRGIVKEATAAMLDRLPGLRVPRGDALAESVVPPVPWEVVEATLPFLPPSLAAMVRVHYHGAMRSQDICRLRPGDLWRSTFPDGSPLPHPGVWLYLPGSLETGGLGPGKHKTAVHGHRREIWLGPRAQAALAPYLDKPPELPCFSPALAIRETRTALRKKDRKTPVYPWEEKARAKRDLAARLSRTPWRVDSYGHAIARACRRASAKLGRDIAWTPHQLRHAKATAVEQAGGESGHRDAGLILGDRDRRVVWQYADRDRARAAQVAAALG